MAGKSNKGKARKATQQSAVNASEQSEQSVSSDSSLNESSGVTQANGETDLSETNGEKTEVNDQENTPDQHPTKEGGVHLYPVSVKTQGGEKLELQLSPVDSVLDVRQFLLEAPETCFFTCYDLLLHTKDGSVHHLEDHNEIAEVADITTGSCLLEMVSALYDDRSIRAHVQRSRDLLSLSTLHSSLSTVLALQHETAKKGSSNSGDTVKPEVPELESLGFMQNIESSLSNLSSPLSKDIKCVESIVFSSFNPPPSHRRLSGDLIYLDVATLEGNKYCITGTTKTFYVNSSTGNVLDPKPQKASLEAATLIGLLQKISPKFKKAFREILERKASAHPFENVQFVLPPNSWLGSYPIPDHKRDPARAENSVTLSFGSELIGMQRDWNEELQACREFPHATHQERILRDRALHKVTSDFVDAATSGAMGVINRCIPPINPTDPECFHMYVHNNIFFSFAVDSDLEQLPLKPGLEENSKVRSTTSIPKSSEKAYHNQEEGISEAVNGDESSVSNAETIVANGASPDVPAESQLAESEQATYASANNDLKGTKAYQEADVPGLYNLAMAIIDYRGHRIVAQSVLPGILQGDKSDSLLYGSVDNGKKICWSEDFHFKVLEAAKHLHLKEHTVLDGSCNAIKLAAPVECKGIVGSDDRHYLLDLMRATPRDANYTGQGSRFCILRPELISSFCQAEEAKASGKTSHSEQEQPISDSSNTDSAEDAVKDEVNAASAPSELQLAEDEKLNSEDVSHPKTEDTSKKLLFNPNVFTEFKLAGDPEEIAADEENVRRASLYLKNVTLPKFVQDLCSLEVSPMDGQTLTEALHAHGINIRYIGKIAEGTKHMSYLWDLCTNEMVVRSAKHIAKGILRDTEDHDLAYAISHFFNCFFGKVQLLPSKGVGNSTHSKTPRKGNSGNRSSGKFSKGQAKLTTGGETKKKQPLYLSITSDSLWADIQEFVKLKYQFELPEDARQRVKSISVLRNLCLKIGITVAAHKYDFNSLAPFQGSDILNIQPVVKHSIPVCSEAKELIETGKVQLAEGMLPEAFTLFSQAFTLLQQVTGPMHREVASCCRYLAMVAYHAGDMAGAIIQQHKELIINEHCLGLDHPDTGHSYGNMALFYHGLKQSELALRHMARALLLLGLSSGTDHPDVSATFVNVAMMYHDVGKVDTSLRYLQEALKKNARLLGEDHLQTAVCYHALAIVFNSMGTFKLSYQHEKKTYDILVKQLGEEDTRTKESQNWMKAFKMREMQVSAQKQKGESATASTQKAIELLKNNPDLIQAFQAAAVSRGTANSANKSSNNAVLGETLPRGRGVDERGARAAAEVRKKAVARGLLTRPHAVPVQAMPPLTQLLDFINTGMTSDSTNVANGKKNEEANGHAANGEEKLETNESQSQSQSQSEQQDQAAAQPVGSQWKEAEIEGQRLIVKLDLFG